MDFKEKIIAIIPFILIVFFLFVITFLIGSSFEKNIIQENLMWITPIFLAITFSLIVFSFLWCFKDWKKLFKKIDKKTWIILLVILLVGLSLRTFVAPQTHRLYYDEDIYLNIGQNIARDGQCYRCAYGTHEECLLGTYNKQPNGYPFLIGILFFFTGTSGTTVHYANTIISSLTIIMVFLVAYLLFKNEKIGIFSALIFTLMPVAIRWAPTTSSDTVFVFFTGLTVFAFLFYLKNSYNRTLLFALVSLAFTIQIRPEGFLLIPIIVVLFIFLKKDLFYMIRKKEFLIVLLLFSVLIVPHLLHLNSVKDDNWQAAGDKLGVQYVGKNLEDNSMFFFENTIFPVVFTILAFIGLAYRKIWKKKTFLGIWFLSFFVLYLLFYVGSFYLVATDRFSLNLYLPIAILGGCGAFLIMENLNKIVKKRWVSFGIVALIITASFIPFIGFVSSYGEKGWDAKLAHDFIEEKMENMDDDCWVVTMVPSVVLNHGKNAVSAYHGLHPEIMDEVFNKSDCVFFYEGYWCSPGSQKSNIAAHYHNNYNLSYYDSLSMTERGVNKIFTLYYMER